MHLKVVSSKEMARIEKMAISENDLEFIQKAGLSIAKKIQEISTSKKILLLLGKGNKAADGLCASIYLLKKGYKVKAVQFFDETSFSKGAFHFFKHFQKEGGVIEKKLHVEKDEIILDALFGIGFEGDLSGFVLEAIQKINPLSNLKIAIDVPSGLDGSTGQSTAAFKADFTFYIELPKTGFFVNKGWDAVGKLEKIEIGLEKKFIDQAKANFYLPDEKIASSLPKIKRSRNKYESFVVGITGSFGMEGSANLSGRASLRSGAGIVKLALLDYKNEEMSDELVKIKLDLDKRDEVLSLCNSAKALYIGPGLGRTKEISDLLAFLIPKIKVPVVLDADGLYFFAYNLNTKLPEKIVMTPHKKEMYRLLGKEVLDDLELIEETQKFVDKYKTVLVLKGAPSFIFSPNEKPTVALRGDPGMAKAGTGDVLTGIIAALLAQGLDPLEAASLGTYVHGICGEEVVKEKTAFSLIASDLIENLPKTFKKLSEDL